MLSTSFSSCLAPRHRKDQGVCPWTHSDCSEWLTRFEFRWCVLAASLVRHASLCSPPASRWHFHIFSLPGQMNPLLWQWCHPSHLLVPSGALTANWKGGVAASWLFSSSLLLLPSPEATWTYPGDQPVPSCSGVQKQKGGSKPSLFSNPRLVLSLGKSQGRIWARVYEMLCYRNLPWLPKASFWLSELPSLPALRRFRPGCWLCASPSVWGEVSSLGCPLQLSVCPCHCLSHRESPAQSWEPSKEAGLAHSAKRRCCPWLSNSLFLFLQGKQALLTGIFFYYSCSHIPS